MMPMAPNAIMSVNAITKPKIGFSIDSIVGTNRFIVNSSSSNICSPTTSDSSERASSPYSDCCYQSEINLCNNNSLQTSSRPSASNERATNKSVNIVENVSNELNNYQINRFSNSPTNLQIFKPLSPLSLSLQQQSAAHTNNNIDTFKSAPIFSTKLSPATTLCQSTSPTPGQSETIPHSTPPPPIELTSTQPLSSAPIISSLNKGSILLPNLSHNIIRPFPLSSQNLSDIKTLSTSTPSPYGFNSNNEIVGTRHLSNSHFLAAQFQMASAMANGQPFQQNTHPVHLHNSNLVRDTYPLYPWLIGRNGRIFPHRFPGNFLLQPFRKPKRVRTAFSPSQLLKLEHAFEGNHYVVGAERKTLAQSLHLTETQVKVWFQNRRTKHKRMQQDEDAKNCNNGNISKMLHSSSDDINNDNNDLDHISYDDDDDDDDDDDELIDMDDCSSDDSNVGQQIM